jgi:hypothetical protein
MQRGLKDKYAVERDQRFEGLSLNAKRIESCDADVKFLRMLWSQCKED